MKKIAGIKPINKQDITLNSELHSRFQVIVVKNLVCKIRLLVSQPLSQQITTCITSSPSITNSPIMDSSFSTKSYHSIVSTQQSNSQQQGQQKQNEPLRNQLEHYMSNFDEILKVKPKPELTEEEKGVVQFLKTTKINVYKNLIYAFQKHIENCSDPKLIEYYESLSEDCWNFESIRARIIKNLKGCNRYGLKMKNLTSNNNLKNIFIHFLKNSKTFWLDKSKIKDKEILESSISLLLRANDFNILSNNISYYKKHRK